jgi:aryl-alcohol dehydrogenase-like predicted oxidoreductase
LYFCHRFDPDTSIDEVLFTMDMLVRQGKILYWGTSEWRAWQITAAFLSAKDNHLIPPVVEQPQYNMFHRQRVEVELEQICKDYGIGLTTWSPLYYGILTGKYNDGIPQDSRAALDGMDWIRDRITEERIGVVRTLAKIADDLHISTGQLAIAWLLRRKEVSSVITGATRTDQLLENIAAAEAVVQLSEEVLERIEAVLGNYPDED